MQDIPQKAFYKLSELCQYTDIQPYVLRFWESEFPQLRPARSSRGQAVYSRESLELVGRIKRLLDEESRSIAEARALLEQESATSRPTTRDAPAPADAAAPEAVAEAPDDDLQSFDGVPRSRYEDALEEISHLRLKLQEAETSTRRGQGRVEQAEAEATRQRGRADLALERLRGVLELLAPDGSSR